MSVFRSAILFVFPDDPPKLRDRILRNADVSARYFGSKLSVCAFEEQLSDWRDRVGKVLHGKTVSLFALSPKKEWSQQMANMLEATGADWVMTSIRTRPALRRISRLQWRGNRVRRALLEACSVPTYVFSSLMELGEKPFSAIVVPMSGEDRQSDGLSLGLRMGKEFSLPVDLVHVTEAGESGLEKDRSGLGASHDEFHHEYPHMVEEFIAEAAPYSTLVERQTLRQFTHCRGAIGDAVNRKMKGMPTSLLVIEWKGEMKPGHAKTVKEILCCHCHPTLLIRTKKHEESRLKVGKDFAA